MYSVAYPNDWSAATDFRMQDDISIIHHDTLHLDVRE
jgi:hypothetical protein